MFHVKLRPDADSEPPIPVASIRDALAQIGVRSSADQAARLAVHARMVLDANKRFNLTRICEPADVVTLHIADSALAIEAVQGAPAGKLADLGSGAGYPGVVLAILGERPTLLVESVKKKARFLSTVVLELGAGMDVFPGRAEDLARERAGEFAVVTARAVAPLPSLVELAAPLLRQGGRLVAMKAKPEAAELLAGLKAARVCGMREVSRTATILAGEHTRTLVVYERVGSPAVRLPRRVGLAQQVPLG